MKAPLHQLLVHLDDAAPAAVRLAYARKIAARHEAALAAAYAVIPSMVEVPFAAEAGPQALDALREIDVQRRAQAHAVFDASQAPGDTASWCELSGFPLVSSFSEQALYADLLVLGQHQPEGGPAGIPFDFVESVLLTAGKPALVVPYTARALELPQTLAIAWKPTREAARAVAAALPLLQQAREVHVLTWGEGATTPAGGLDLPAWLQRRGVEARWHREAEAEPDTVGDHFLSRACDLGADLLVMGVYGHSRAREWVLGGASRTVLQAMTVPVLVAH
ncbi:MULTISPECIES: universal stress protein [Ramlibacter]|uniref:Universal stress protein n=1 Tax=Ramlibacter aquaticus TaxID=2780094 RepID=A0ABR9SE59_9BURK|nr:MULTISPECIES: universal stress protein [Ramlibacter]MBE7940635.1 universal stress protein [Ramlibacter aquaticus]